MFQHKFWKSTLNFDFIGRLIDLKRIVVVRVYKLLLASREKVFQPEILATHFILVALHAQLLKTPFFRDQLFCVETLH